MVNTNGYCTKTPNYFLADFLATGLLAVAFFAAAFLAAGLFPVFLAAGLFVAFSADFFTTFLTFAPSAPLPLLVEPFFTFFGVTFLLAVLPSTTFLAVFFGTSTFFTTFSLGFFS